ncbi:MAG: DUF5320 domain-containing protein [Crocosphaera sp.]
MAFNDSEGLGQEINEMLDKVEKKIREIKELNRPILDGLDKQEIEQRIKALEARDDADKQALRSQIRTLEEQLNLMNNRLYKVMLVLLAIFGVFAFFIDIL